MNGNRRVCLVTGGSRGIGQGIATELARRASDVVVNYRSSEAAAHDVVDQIEAAGGSGYAIQADVSDLRAVERMGDRIHDVVGRVAVLVNNAGITRDAKLGDMVESEWNRVIDVNLNGVFNCAKVFYDDIESAIDGRVISISSVVGQQGNYGQTNYAAAKGGIGGFTRSLAHELAPSGSTANCVAPGFTQTDMLDDVDERVRDRIRAKIPLGRFAAIEEVAAVVGFLASRESSYVTGATIDVDGGIAL